MFDFLQYYGGKKEVKNDKRLELTPFPPRNRVIGDFGRDVVQRSPIGIGQNSIKEQYAKPQVKQLSSLRQPGLINEQLAKLFEEYHRQQVALKCQPNTEYGRLKPNQPISQKRKTAQDIQSYSSQVENKADSLRDPTQTQVSQRSAKESSDGRSQKPGNQKLYSTRLAPIKTLEMHVMERSPRAPSGKPAPLRHYPHQAIPRIISSIGHPTQVREQTQTQP